MVEKKLYCNNHCQYYRNVFAAKIQSLWRGFKQRRMINVIYKRLPEELQIKILYFLESLILERNKGVGEMNGG